MGMDINGGNNYCWACRGPVYYTSLRCPHCTSALGGGGSNPDSEVGLVGTLAGLGVVYAFIAFALLRYSPEWAEIWLIPARLLGAVVDWLVKFL